MLRSTEDYHVEGRIFPYKFPIRPKPEDPIDGRNYPDIPAVYVVLRKAEKEKDKAATVELVYVGSTDEGSTMRKQFPAHWDNGGEGPCFDGKGGWTHWGFIETKDGPPKLTEDDILLANEPRCSTKSTADDLGSNP